MTPAQARKAERDRAKANRAAVGLLLAIGRLLWYLFTRLLPLAWLSALLIPGGAAW